MIHLQAGAATDVGLVRTNNQDQILIADPLFAVADGMGGAAAGEVASALAVESLKAAFAASDGSADGLVQAALTANRTVWDQAEANPEMRGMGTTLVALALVEGPRLAIVNVGDSRLYAFQGDQLRQVTDDHNLVAEMVAQGRISKEEAEVHPRRNIMTRALGVDPDVPVDLFVEEARPGDRYLLCSDGLPREVSDDQIASFLRRLADPSEAARVLVDEAKRRGGNDNISVVVVDVVDSDNQQVQRAEELTVDDPTVGIAPVPPRRGRRRRQERQYREGSGILTFRVALFVFASALIVVGAAIGVIWYARSGYFVGLDGQNLTIFEGQPGGVLWFHPTTYYVTSVTASQIEPRHLHDVQAGRQEPNLAAARQYVESLMLEKLQSDAAAAAPPVTPPAPLTSVPAAKTSTS